MSRWPVLLCFATLVYPGCIGACLPVLPTQGYWQGLAVPEESRLAVPADQAEQLLERAAAQLAQGQELEAAALLEQYLAIEPRHLFIRSQVAELYFRQKKWEQARRHFQWCVGLAQEFGDPAYKYLIHAHSRLVDIAEAEENAYAEHLHRGIGLYELACRRGKENDTAQELSVTTILGRAAVSLTNARNEDPLSARAHWYLYLVWSQLGQHAAAKNALLQADAQKFFAELTPMEKREMQAATWREEAMGGKVVGK